MAKTLIAGQTVTNQYGDIWDEAILVCDYIRLDYKDGNYQFRVDIYKDTAARAASYRPVSDWHTIDQPTFNANFDSSAAVTTMKAQSEDYALIMIDPEDGVSLLYGSKFE